MKPLNLNFPTSQTRGLAFGDMLWDEKLSLPVKSQRILRLFFNEIQSFVEIYNPSSQFFESR